MGAPGSGHGGLLREEAGRLGAPLAQCTGAFDPQGPHLSEPLPSSTPTPPRSARREADRGEPQGEGTWRLHNTSIKAKLCSWAMQTTSNTHMPTRRG